MEIPGDREDGAPANKQDLKCHNIIVSKNMENMFVFHIFCSKHIDNTTESWYNSEIY